MSAANSAAYPASATAQASADSSARSVAAARPRASRSSAAGEVALLDRQPGAGPQRAGTFPARLVVGRQRALEP
jgi:hypothetical protein